MSTWRNVATGLVLGIAAIMASGWAAQSQNDPGARGERRVVAESRFAVTDAGAQADLVALVVDFAAGAWTSLHTHGGQAINLVLDGEITLRHGGMDRPHRAGQSWTDSTSQVHAAGNTGAGPARLLTNFLLPKGAPQITVVKESELGPSIAAEARFALPSLAAETEIVSQVVDLSPGWHAERAVAGFTAIVVMEGEVAYGLGPERKNYGAGDSWSAPAGAVMREDNMSAGTARVFVTCLVSKGAAPPQ